MESAAPDAGGASGPALTKKDTIEAKNELESNEQGETFDVLGWWKTYAFKFDMLSKMARDVLVVPISTVSSESAFSTRGRVLDVYRNSLAITTVEALICAQNWLKPIEKDKKESTSFPDDSEDFEDIDFDVVATPRDGGNGGLNAVPPKGEEKVEGSQPMAID